MSAMAAGLTLIGYIWALLSLASSLAACFAFYMADWLVDGRICSSSAVDIGTAATNSQQTQQVDSGVDASMFCVDVRFGSFRRCGYFTYDDKLQQQLTNDCGRYSTFDSIPDLWWKVCTVLGGVGASLSLLVGLLSVPACCISDVLTRSTARLCGFIQILAGFLLVISCIIFPIGWNSQEILNACGSHAGIYSLGHCQIGWSYWTLLVCAVVLFLCCALSWKAGHSLNWTIHNKNGRLLKPNLDESSIIVNT